MRIATLNIRQGGGTRVPAILQFITRLNADVLVLTEFRAGPKGAEIRDSLRACGYEFQTQSSVDAGRNAVLIASRIAASIIDLAAGPPSQEHCLSVIQVRELTLCACYFPQGERKRPVFDRVLELSSKLHPLGLVLGDLNTGLPFQDEKGQSFKCIDAFQSLVKGRLIDAWRSRHPSAREYSWLSSHGNGFRIDHALATVGFNSLISRVEYDHSPRESRITDHSALVVFSEG